MTPMQEKIVELRGHDLTFPVIAERLGVSESVVTHQARKIRKLGVALPQVSASIGGGKGTDWTPERVERLKQLWADPEMTASRIAAELGGGLSRSAVIGKVHRLGIQDRGGKKPAQGASRPKRSRVGPARAYGRHAPLRAPAIDIPAEDVWKPLPGVQPVRQDCLGDTTCRWPVEDGKPRRGFDRLFCGSTPRSGFPYCPVHAAKHVNRGVAGC